MLTIWICLQVSPDCGYPAVDLLVDGYLDRMRGLCLHHVDEAPLDSEGRLDPVSSYMHTYGVIHEHWHVEVSPKGHS